MMNSQYSKTIKIQGLNTHYLEAGSGEPLVLVHGGGAGADAIGNWTALIELLKNHFHIFAVDMVGFGHTEIPESPDYIFSQQSRDNHLIEFIKKIDIGPVYLVGNSMGGLTSLAAARKHPQLIKKLVLMGSAGIQMTFSPELLSILHYDYSIAGMQKIVEGLTGPNYVVPEGLIEYRHSLTTSEKAKNAYQGIIDWQRKQGGLHIDEELIKSITVPTLVVSGKNDLVVPLSSTYKFLELIPHSWGTIMPECGHWPMIEKPNEFAKVLKTFLIEEI